MDGDEICLQLIGELDLSVAGTLGERLAALANNRQHVRLDLHDLTFVDSSGMSVLVHAWQRAASDGWELTFDPELQDEVRRVIEVVGLDELFWP